MGPRPPPSSPLGSTPWQTQSSLNPSDNHVGLDLGFPLSISTVDLAAPGIDLKSGNHTTAWIDYRITDHRLEVFLSYATHAKP